MLNTVATPIAWNWNSSYWSPAVGKVCSVLAFCCCLISFNAAATLSTGNGLRVNGSISDPLTLFNAQEIAVSSDGIDLYVVSLESVVHFRRDAITGVPSLQQVYENGVGSISGLYRGLSVALSPDGENLYVGTSRGTVNFARSTTSGALTFIESLSLTATADQVTSVVVSPDSDHVYLALHAHDRLAVMSRDPLDGSLSHQSSFYNGDAGYDSVAGPRGLAISQDGTRLAVVSAWSDALVLFTLDAVSGAVTPVAEAKDLPGLTEPHAVVFSPDGAYLYVTSPWEGSVSVWGVQGGAPITLSSVQMISGDDPGMAGLERALEIRLTSSGLSAVVTGHGSLSLFDRDLTTGQLSLVETLFDGTDGVGGLAGEGFALPVGDFVYHASAFDDALTYFGDRGSATGSIAGTLTTSESSVPAGVQVQAFTLNLGSGQWEPRAAAWTDETGSYQIDYLDADTYRVCFAPDASDRFVPECYDGAEDTTTATDLILTPNAALTAINAQLAMTPLTGQVVDSLGAPLPDTEVRLARRSPTVTPHDDVIESWTRLATSTSDGAGLFDLGEWPVGVYRLCFAHPDLVLECVEHVPGQGHYMGQLEQPAGAISGAVIGSDGRPLTGVRVTAATDFTWTGTGGHTWPDGYVLEEWNSAETGIFGHYRIGSLDAVDYLVCFEADGYFPECFEDTVRPWEAQWLTVAADTVTHPVNALLEPVGNIQGTVSTEAGLGIADVIATAYVLDNQSGDWRSRSSARTDSAGAYSLAVPAGVVRVCFEDSSWPETYLPQCYLDTDDVSSATDVEVLANQVTPNIDVVMAEPGSISGSVTDSGGAPIEGVYVQAGVWVAYGDSQSGGELRDTYGAPTQADGSFTITGLPPGDYSVCFYDDWWDGTFATECYADSVHDAPTTTVTVGSGDAVTGIDADLTAYAAVIGLVVESTSPFNGLDQLSVSIRPLDGPNASDWYYSTETYGGGGFVFDGWEYEFLPGNHELCVRDYDLGAYSSRCETLTLLEGDNFLAPIPMVLAVADVYEPDEGELTAAPISTGIVQTRNFVDGSSDWASFTVSGPDPQAVVIQAAPKGFGYVSMHLIEEYVDPYGGGSWLNWIDSADSYADGPGAPTPAEISRLNCAMTALQPGDYFVELSGGDGADSAYDLSLELYPCTGTVDTDGDTIFNDTDNCLLEPNPLQLDLDGDGIGDACDPANVFMDAFEPDDDPLSASPITPSTPQARTFHNASDWDYASFNLTEETAVEISAVPAADFGGDLYLDLLEWYDDGSGGGWYDYVDNGYGYQYDADPPTPALIQRLPCGSGALPAGQYVIESSSYSAIGSSAYDLSVSLYPCGPSGDGDADGVPHSQDNCPYAANPLQTDTNGNGVGDACDPVDAYEPDNSSGTASPISSGDVQEHDISPASDEDWVSFTLGSRSAIELETSGDTYGDTELFLYDAALTQIDYNDCGGNDCYSRISRTCEDDPLAAGTYYARVTSWQGYDTLDAYDLAFTATPCPAPPDTDGDGVTDSEDNCPTVANADQDDSDGDGVADACDVDDDNDLVDDNADNCSLFANISQSDGDGDGIGDACDPDTTVDLLDYLPLVDGLSWDYTGYDTSRLYGTYATRLDIVDGIDLNGTTVIGLIDSEFSGGAWAPTYTEFLSTDATSIILHGWRDHTAGPPPEDWLNNPPQAMARNMAVGDSHTVSTQVQAPDGSSYPASLTYSLDAIEDVVVPAGYFPGCVRVAFDSTDGSQSIEWWAQGVGPVLTAYQDQNDPGLWWINELVSTNGTIPIDTDQDGVVDGNDNCPAEPNLAQIDSDRDGAGDACDNAYTMCDADAVLVDTHTFPPGTHAIASDSRITMQGAIHLQPGADLSLTAPTIALRPGFSVAKGAALRLEAAGAGCVAGTNQPTLFGAPDGMPATAMGPELSAATPAAPATPPAPRLLADPGQLPEDALDVFARFGIDPAAIAHLLADADGNWLLFETAQDIAAADTNGLSDIYRLDLFTETLSLLSRSLDGSAGNGASRYPATESSGELVVFQSDADDLVEGDDNGFSDLFLHDVPVAVTSRITPMTTGASAHPALDAAGADLLYDQRGEDGRRHVLLQGLWGGAPEQPLSAGYDGAGLPLDNHHPAISADGRYVAYLEAAVEDADTDCRVAFYDRDTGWFEHAPCPPAVAADPDAARPTFIDDGSELEWILPQTELLPHLRNPVWEAGENMRE